MDPSTDPKMEAFRIVRSLPSLSERALTRMNYKLKPLCVPLMGLRPLTPQTQASAHAHLVRLLVALRQIPNPKDAFTPSLVRYTLFPLSHLLTRNNPAGRKEGEVGYIADRTMEVLFECLEWVMRRWLEGGEEVDVRIWEQLWRMVVLILGGPIGGDSRHEPRAEETMEAGIKLLEVLVCSQPSEEMREAVFGPGRRLLPVLFHTISTLVEITTTAISPHVVQQSLQVMNSLLENWFADDDKARVLAGVMPGIISAIVKIISGAPSVAEPRGMQTVWNDISATKQRTTRKSPSTDVACAALQLFSTVVVLTIGDAPLIACRVLASQVTDLESLVSDLTVNDSDERTLLGSPTPSASSTQTLQNRADPFPQLTPTYLAYTRTQLTHSLNALLPTLTTHHAPRVRLALVDALSRIAQSCARALDSDESTVQDILLTTLLALGSPYEPSPDVSLRARSVIREWVEERQVQTRLRAILERELGAFPAAVQAHSERRIGSCVDVIMTLAALARESDANALRRDFAHLLGPNGGVVKWSWPLLACLELARPVEMETDPATDGTTRAWDLARIENGSVMDSISGDARTEAFPRMTLVHVESRTTVDRIAGMLEALGGAAGVSGVATVEQLLAVAGARRGGAVASSVLWVVGRIVDGLGGKLDAGDVKRVKRAARRIVDLVVQFDDDGDLPLDSPEEPSTEVTTVERRRGLGTISKLLDDSKRTPTAAVDSSRRAHAAVHRELVTCLHLSLLASCARILSTSFRRHLDATLYIILSHLGSPHPFVRRYAQVALAHVSYHAGYASAQNLILDNVDYVINRVSQRMTYDRLDTLAPMVLISMIKLVGEPIVPLVQDIIADIFDALDDFHGYALLASTVLAVMDTLMKAMAAEVPPANTIKGSTSTSVRLRRAPDPACDFATFTAWYADRAVKARQTMDELLERAPEKPWDRPKDAQETADEGPSNASADTETPPTRAQEVCIQMMQKSVYFLTHANPFITARVLSLFASGVPVLISQERESDALPLIHQAWPSILNRLQDPAPFVRTEAAALVECLARWTGDFMSRRILDDAWPIFQQLLAEQKQRDDHSALAKRGVRGTTSGYTISHRLYLSIIHAMHLVVQKVPIADDLFWEILLDLRPFLDSRVHPELGSAAVKMYRSMAERDEDAVWLALNATMGTVVADQPLPVYLREPGMDIRHGVELVV